MSERLLLIHIVLEAKALSGTVWCSDADSTLSQERNRRGRQIIVSNEASESIPMAARTKACVCGCWLAGILGSNSSGDMDICIL